MPTTSNIVQVSASVPNNEGITGIPTVFTFTFPQQIVASDFNVIFRIYEDSVIKEARNISKRLQIVKGDATKGTAELTFPEALAGATLDIKYALLGPINTSVSATSIKIKRADGLVAIEKVYWGEQEHALWGTKLTERREIFKNEWAFLHIYTKGMFGHAVLAQIQEEDNDKTEIRPIKDMNVVIRDNVLSVPYSMENAISDFKSKFWTLFEGECLELYARVHPDKTQINSGTRSPNLLLFYKKEEKDPAKQTAVPPVKVMIAGDEKEKEIITKAQCSLEFRPDNTYIGDYGFDWVRKGDTGIPQPFNDYAFRDCMGKHFASSYTDPTTKTTFNFGKDIVQTDGNEHGPFFRKDKDRYVNTYISQTDMPELDANNINTVTELDNSFGDERMYERLKKRYKKIIFGWKDTTTTKYYETYTPIMTLMNGKTAKLDLYLDNKVVPEKIVFEFSNSQANNYLTLSPGNEIKANLSVGLDKTKHKLAITCNGEFDDEYILYARAFGKNDPKGEICGMLRILPNSKMYQHRIKIVLFKVKTNINGSEEIGKISVHKKRIKEILAQALINADIEDVDLDTTANRSFRADYCKQYNGVGPYLIDDDETRSWALRTYLEGERDKKYDHYYKIYFFNEEEAGSNGYSWGYKYTVCFNTANSETGIHELLHALELAHPFDAHSRNTKYTYEYRKTDNIMDYSHHILLNSGVYFTRRSLFHWQWQIINLKIR